VDAKANIWSADFAYSTGTVGGHSSAAISGTADPTLYQTYRFAAGAGPVLYQFNMPNGTHTVNLGFAETLYTAAGQRVFNIVLNGQTVRSRFDIFAAAGSNKAVVLTFPVTVTNGQVLIQLTNVVNSAKLNVIEIIP